jgi:hypothetical protein
MPRRAPLVSPDPGTRAPGWRASQVELAGDATSVELSPPGFSLRLVAGVLGRDSALRFGTDHPDEVLYVRSGSLDVDGRECPAGGAVIVEAGVPAEVRASEAADLLHFQIADGDVPNAPRSGHLVHVVGPGGTWAAPSEPNRETRYFADSTCDSCRATLLLTGRSTGYESPAHSHSQDELIHVLHGELQLGAERAGPGATLAIAKDVRYRFRSEGFLFLNYRRDASYQTLARDQPPVLEGGAVHGFTPVMDLR